MKPATINNQNYLIPESWNDLTVVQGLNYIEARSNNANDFELIQVLTCIPVEILENMTEVSLTKLMLTMDFVNDEALLLRKVPKKEYEDFDYGSIKYKQAEKIRQIIDGEKSMLYNCPEVFKYLFGVDLSQEPLPEWIGTVNFFLNSWGASMLHLNILKAKGTRPNKSRQELDGLNGSGALALM